MSFWDDLGEFFTGSSKKSDFEKKREQLFDDMRNYDNRMNDFNQLAGTALNSLASRGVINSSVGSNAMGSALGQADKNYWDNQKALLNFQTGYQDSPGFLQHLGASAAKGLGDGIGKLANPMTWLGLG